MAASTLSSGAFLLILFVANSFADFPYKETTFTQYVDHYNLMSFGGRTFEEKVLYQDKHWGGDGYPIFFYAGNEGPIESFWDATGFVHEIAPEFKAYVVFPEHRFYGKSLPFGNASFTSPNLGVLSVAQAVADYAVFLTNLKVQLKAPNSRIIAFGGSYGGMLAAYMRYKHPSIVYGALAASAPVYMQDPAGPHDFFFARVTNDYRGIAEKCYTDVKAAFAQISSLAQQGSAGLTEISKKMHLCQPLTNTDLTQLQLWARNAFVMMAMLDYPYPTDFMGKLPGNPVKTGCQAIMNQADTLNGLADLVGVWYNSSGTNQCYDIHKEYIYCADPTGCGLGSDSVAWNFQACSDLWLPDGSNGVTDMFPELHWDQTIRAKYCKAKFGIDIRSSWDAQEFFGLDLNGTSRIIFSNGNLDPWMGGGITHDLSDSLISVIVEGGAHHLDLRASNKLDPPGVITAREKERGIIRNWLNQK